jgi:hypothetical protein
MKSDWEDPTEEAADEGEGPQQRLALGVVLGAAGGFGAMMAWYGLIIATGYEVGYAAWGVGVVVGVATLLGARRGDNILGFVAGSFALAAIVGGQYFAFNTTLDKELRKHAETVYQADLEFAERAAAAETGGQIRGIIAEVSDDAGEKRDILKITDEEVEAFRAISQPLLAAFANGNPSKEKYVEERLTEWMAEASKFERLKESVSLWTILWLFLGVGTAFKIASGGGGNDDEADPRERMHRRRRRRAEGA